MTQIYTHSVTHHTCIHACMHAYACITFTHGPQRCAYIHMELTHDTHTPQICQELFYYSPSAPLYSYSANPICQSYLGTNCVAMGSGSQGDWPMRQPIPTVAGPRTWNPET